MIADGEFQTLAPQSAKEMMTMKKTIGLDAFLAAMIVTLVVALVHAQHQSLAAGTETLRISTTVPAPHLMTARVLSILPMPLWWSG